jgi:hypothetical protein
MSGQVQPGSLACRGRKNYRRGCESEKEGKKLEAVKLTRSLYNSPILVVTRFVLTSPDVVKHVHNAVRPTPETLHG